MTFIIPIEEFNLPYTCYWVDLFQDAGKVAFGKVDCDQESKCVIYLFYPHN